MLASELQQNKAKALRCHRVAWDETSEPNGFTSLNLQLRDLPAWQFEISVNEHGRVHGFFIDRTFYLVWIDPEHLLYA
jgi:hypothetical protein